MARNPHPFYSKHIQKKYWWEDTNFIKTGNFLDLAIIDVYRYTDKGMDKKWGRICIKFCMLKARSYDRNAKSFSSELVNVHCLNDEGLKSLKRILQKKAIEYCNTYLKEARLDKNSQQIYAASVIEEGYHIFEIEFKTN